MQNQLYYLNRTFKMFLKTLKSNPRTHVKCILLFLIHFDGVHNELINKSHFPDVWLQRNASRTREMRVVGCVYICFFVKPWRLFKRHSTNLCFVFITLFFLTSSLWGSALLKSIGIKSGLPQLEENVFYYRCSCLDTSVRFIVKD